MIEIAIPAEYFFDAPAKAYDIGIMAAVPKPTNENPIIAGQKSGKTTASPIPKMIHNALMI
ncbi:hypothetical protein D3C85_1759510 [compost metagenome]